MVNYYKVSNPIKINSTTGSILVSIGKYIIEESTGELTISEESELQSHIERIQQDIIIRDIAIEAERIQKEQEEAERLAEEERIRQEEWEASFPQRLEQAKLAKIAELRNSCNTEILGGFYSMVKGTNELYGMDYEDQINLESLKNNAVLGIIPDGNLEYYAKGKPCEMFTNAEFLQLYSDAMTFKISRIKKVKDFLIPLAEVATTIEELDAIVW